MSLGAHVSQICCFWPRDQGAVRMTGITGTSGRIPSSGVWRGMLAFPKLTAPSDDRGGHMADPYTGIVLELE